ncbi:MAG: TonB-dependent receptor [Bacteroidales bacterium]|nr:TonB-dependent receptor [Bacteroidales bacterium]
MKNNLIRLLGLILVMSLASGVMAQKLVKGEVKSQDGETLVGVTILIEGTMNGTISDYDGQFQLQVPDGAQRLILSTIGFVTDSIMIDNREYYSIVMRENVEVLGDVVVVGYGQQKKESVVGAITQAKGEQLLASKGDLSLTNTMDGVIPGITVIQTTGEPGSSAAEIFIRGKSSWNNNSPLILVDGIERDFDDIDPNDVESMSVLKDASATAVFGVKGANGVILITTKQGKEGKAKINASFNISLKQPTTAFNFLDHASTLELYNQALEHQGIYDPTLYYSQDVINKYRYKTDPYLYPEIDWFDYMTKDVAVTQKYNVNISGGKKFIKYYTSLSYSKEGDVFNSEKQDNYDPRFNYQRFNYKANVSFQLTKSTTMKLQMIGNMATKNASNYSSKDLMNDITNRAPRYLFPAYYENGQLGDYVTTGASNNPVVLLNYNGAKETKTNKVYTDFIFDQKLDFITKGLKFNGKVSYNSNTSHDQVISNKINNEINVIRYYYQEQEDGSIIQTIYPTDDFVLYQPVYNAESINYFARDLYYEMSLRYNRTFNKHRVGLLGLFQRRKDFEKVKFRLPTEDWVARAEYMYDSRYMIEASGAYNGSDKFAPGQRFGFFPAVAVGWMISNERFVADNFDFIDELKVRYSYGEVGSDIGAARWTYMTQYETNGKVYFGNPAGGKGTFTEGTPGNADATWETAIKQNLGFELGLFDRFTATVDLFDERREGILMQRVTIPTWFGQENPYANIGETKTHGYEIAAEYHTDPGRDWQLIIGGNFNFSENRVVHRDDPQDRAEYQKDAGKPIGSEEMLVVHDLYRDWDDVYMYTPSDWNQGDRRPGDVIYVDYDGDGQITNLDRIAYGNLKYPEYTYGFNGSIRYKNWDFSFLFSGAANVSRQLVDNLYYPFIKADALTAHDQSLDAWSIYNQDSNLPANRVSNTNHNTGAGAGYINSLTYMDADYLRLKNVEISYTLRSDGLKDKLGLSSLRIYVNGKDLWTSSKFDDRFDPVPQTVRTYPLMKYYNFGMQASF